MTEIQLQGYKFRRAKVLSKWNRIIRHYEKYGAKETVEKCGVSRTHIYYILRQMKKQA